MSKLKRFSVTVPEETLTRFDKFIESSGYPNRSKMIVDLIRNCLVEESWQNKSEVAGTIVLVYDHHKHGLGSQLTNIQHDYHQIDLSAHAGLKL